MALLANSFVIGTGHAIVFGILFKKLPKKGQEWLLKHPLLLESAAAVATYGTSGGGITAMGSAAVASLEAAAMIHKATHPQDYLWLDALIEKAKSGSKEALTQLDGWVKSQNEEYLRRKAGENK